MMQLNHGGKNLGQSGDGDCLARDARETAYSSDGTTLAVGADSGRVYVLVGTVTDPDGEGTIAVAFQ
jgi:hypothetical protein